MTNPVTKYDLASRMVDREVVANASRLMSTLYEACQYPLDNLRLEEDDIRDLMQTVDYEQPVLDRLAEADVFDLESVVEFVETDWEEFLVENGFPTNDMLDEAVDALWNRVVELEDIEDPTPEQEAECARVRAEHDSLPVDLEDWLKANEGKIEVLRQAVIVLCELERDWENLALELDVEPTYDEVYEHWIVTGFLGRRLQQEGHTVRNVCGLTIWGRGCTGQSIALDYVIQKIAVDLWGDELTMTSPADAF